MKSILIFVLASIILTMLVITRNTNGVASTAKQPAPPDAAAPRNVVTPQEQPGVIDGSLHPELIPDRVAYSLMFRLIGGRRTPQEKSHIRAYINHLGFADADVDGLIAAADEFNQNVARLDAEAKQIKTNNRGNANPQVKGHLIQLQHQKDAIVDYIVVQLPSRLSRDAISKLQQHVAEHVKRHVKYQPT